MYYIRIGPHTAARLQKELSKRHKMKKKSKEKTEANIMEK